MKDTGAISVKSYNQPARSQRQQIIAAARELKMMVVPEGGGKFHQNLTMMVDGHTGLEHSLPIARGYGDLTKLWSAHRSLVTHRLLLLRTADFGAKNIGTTGRKFGKTNGFCVTLRRNSRRRRSIRRPTAPDDQYNHFEVAKYAKTLSDKGVSIHIGAHGQREGLASHWELWIMQQGGFTPWEAIRNGTIDGAHISEWTKTSAASKPANSPIWSSLTAMF